MFSILKKLILLSLVSLFLSNTTVFSQPIWSNPITDVNPSSANPYSTGQVVSSNISVSGIGRGSHVDAANASNRYNADSWTTGSTIDANDYFYFTITPNSGYVIDFVSFIFTGQRSGNGPRNLSFRSSVDNYASVIASPGVTGTTIDLSSFQNIGTSITFRLYGYNADNGNGTYSVNDFQFNGNIGDPLPVTFGSISAKKLGNQLKLNWTTLIEKDNSFFDIQTSTDGQHYKSIGMVKSNAPNGFSSSKLQYEFTIDYNSIALLGIPAVFGLLALGFSKRNKITYTIAALFVLVITIVACSKSDAISIDKNNKLFVKIVQHSANGDTQSSKVVQVVNY